MTELTINVDLESEQRDEMFHNLCERFGEDEVTETLEGQVIKHITEMFDNREQLEEMEERNGNI